MAIEKMKSNRKDLQRKAEIELGGKMPVLKKLVNKSYSNILISYMKLKLNKKDLKQLAEVRLGNKIPLLKRLILTSNSKISQCIRWLRLFNEKVKN